MAEHIIFDSYNTISDENMGYAKQNLIENAFWDADSDGLITVTDNYGIEVRLTREQYGNSLTENDIFNECYEMENQWYNDEKEVLEDITEGGIIAIADIGLWNGRASGYKDCDTLADALSTRDDYIKLYVDSYGNLRRETSNHDASSSVLYRYWKDNVTDGQKDNFRDKIYKGTLTDSDISRYTRKCGIGIADYYGWKVQGSRKSA